MPGLAVQYKGTYSLLLREGIICMILGKQEKESSWKNQSKLMIVLFYTNHLLQKPVLLSLRITILRIFTLARICFSLKKVEVISSYRIFKYDQEQISKALNYKHRYSSMAKNKLNIFHQQCKSNKRTITPHYFKNQASTSVVYAVYLEKKRINVCKSLSRDPQNSLRTQQSTQLN